MTSFRIWAKLHILKVRKSPFELPLGCEKGIRTKVFIGCSRIRVTGLTWCAYGGLGEKQSGVCSLLPLCFGSLVCAFLAGIWSGVFNVPIIPAKKEEVSVANYL